MSQRRLLVAVVDDEECVCRALRRLFLALGMDAETFSSGAEFLESMRIRRPDCAVLDLHLPGLTGLDVQERIAQSGIQVPTILITGQDSAGLNERALAAGVSACLRKPLDDDVLLAAVEAAVQGVNTSPQSSRSA